MAFDTSGNLACLVHIQPCKHDDRDVLRYYARRGRVSTTPTGHRFYNYRDRPDTEGLHDTTTKIPN